MAYKPNAPRGYISRASLKVPGASLINAGAGTLSGNAVMAIRPQNIRPGRTKSTQVFAPQVSEGGSKGYAAIANTLDNAAAVISKRYIKWLDTKAALEAADAQALFQQKASEIWLGKQVEELQPDGSTKMVYQPGFAHTESRAAVDGYNSYESALRAAWQEIGGTLGATAQKKYFTNSLYTLTNALNQGRQHAAMAMKQWDKEVLNRDIQTVQKGVADLLTAGNVQKVRDYLGDQLEQLMVKHPIMDPAAAEKFKQDIMKGTAAYLAAQPGASDKINAFKQLMGKDADLETQTYMDNQYMRAIKSERAERDRLEARAEREKIKRIRANDSALLARIFDPKDAYLPAMSQAVEMFRKEQISTGMLKFIQARHNAAAKGVKLTSAQEYSVKMAMLSGSTPLTLKEDIGIDLGDIDPQQASRLYGFAVTVQNDESKSAKKIGYQLIDKTVAAFQNIKGVSVPHAQVVQKFDEYYSREFLKNQGSAGINVQALVEQAFRNYGYTPQEVEGIVRPMPVKLIKSKGKIDVNAAVQKLADPNSGFTLVGYSDDSGFTVAFKSAESLATTLETYREMYAKGEISEKELFAFQDSVMPWYNYFVSRGEWQYQPVEQAQDFNRPEGVKAPVKRRPTAQEEFEKRNPDSLKAYKQRLGGE